jgi:hypothetical protein
MKRGANFVERRKHPRVGVMGELENIAHSALRKHSIKTLAAQNSEERSKGDGRPKDLRRNDQSIREARHPQTWLLYKGKDVFEVSVLHDTTSKIVPSCCYFGSFAPKVVRQ